MPACHRGLPARCNQHVRACVRVTDRERPRVTHGSGTGGVCGMAGNDSGAVDRSGALVAKRPSRLAGVHAAHSAADRSAWQSANPNFRPPGRERGDRGGKRTPACRGKTMTWLLHSAQQRRTIQPSAPRAHSPRSVPPPASSDNPPGSRAPGSLEQQAGPTITHPPAPSSLPPGHTHTAATPPCAPRAQQHTLMKSTAMMKPTYRASIFTPLSTSNLHATSATMQGGNSSALCLGRHTAIAIPRVALRAIRVIARC